MKTCTKCGEQKPVSEFNKRSSNRDKLQAWCKSCFKVQGIKAYAANPEKTKARVAKYQAANPEKVKARAAKYYALNYEKVKEKSAKYRLENPERAKACVAKWNAENPEKAKAAHAKVYAANVDKIKAQVANWKSANPDKAKASAAKWKASNPESCRVYSHNRRARKRKNGGKLSSGISERLFKLQRGKCACGCGQSLGDDYHLDHIMPLALGGSNTDENIQLLTATCNMQKNAKHPIDFMQSRGFLL